MSSSAIELEPNAQGKAVADTAKNDNGKDGTKGPSVSFGSMFRYADSWDWTLMVVGTIGAVINGFSLPAFSVLFGDLFEALGNGASETVRKSSIQIALVGVASLFASWLQVSCWAWSAQTQLQRLREHYMDSVLRQDCAWYDQNDPGKIAARLGGDCKQFKGGIDQNVGNCIQFLSMFLGGVGVGFYFGWKLTLVILAATPLLAAGAAMLGSTLSADNTETRDAYASAGAVASEVLMSVRTVACFRAQKHEANRYAALLDSAVEVGIKRGRAIGGVLGYTWGIMFMAYGGALWYGGHLVANGEMTPGDVLATFFSVLIGAFSLGQASPSITAIATGRNSAYGLFDVIDRKSQIDPLANTGKELKDVKGHVVFEKVKFVYPTRPAAVVLKGVSIDIPAGQTVALVGESGSGKSTLGLLLNRFYDPVEGRVTIDGEDIRDLNVRSLRRIIGVVSQQPVLFSGTIRENIRFGNPDATDEEVEAAAKAANAYEFIMQLPNGFDADVGGTGIEQLSGGQKQRVAIARAICSNPRILLLDEATSALDSNSETVVQEALQNVSRKCSTIVIAHRLSTIRHADKIVVMKHGSIVEQGSHAELLAIDGAYSALLKTQALSSDGEGDATETEVTETEAANRIIVKDETGEVVVEIDKVATGEELDDQAVKKMKVNSSRLWKMSRPEMRYIIGGVVAAICAGLVMPSFSFLLGELLSSFFKPDVVSEARKWAILFFGLGVWQMVFSLLTVWWFAIAGEHLTKRLRVAMFEAYLRQDVSWFDRPENSPGVLTVRLSSDAELVRGITVDKTSTVIQAATMLCVGMLVAFIYGWRLALVLLAMGPLIAAAGAAQLAFMTGSAEKVAFEDAGRLAAEAASGIRTVATNTAERLVVQKLDEKLKPIVRSGHKEAIGAGLSFGLSQGILFFAYAVSFYYGGYLIDHNLMTDVGAVFKTFFAVIMSFMGAGQVLQIAPDAKKAKLATHTSLATLDLTPEVDPLSTEGEKVNLEGKTIRLENVSFRYPTRPDVKVLDGVTLECPPGKCLALCGPSGSGKSTVVSLIERFYSPEEGVIRIGDFDISSLNLDHLRSQVGLVSQEPVLFGGSIKDNIRYGRPAASDADVEQAAVRANVKSFVDELPDGMDTLVGAHGSQLSGGQRQRIAIARALLMDPKLLLLDEATSALDNESEKLVQQALDELMIGRTSIVIAHRLSTIQQADSIAVIESGRVVEQGSHAELVLRGGVYANLAKLQNT